MRYSKWSDRRSAIGKFKPFIFMLLEITALLMICWLIFTIDIVLLSTLTYVCVMFFILTRVVPRYKQAIKRQSFSEYLE